MATDLLEASGIGGQSEDETDVAPKKEEEKKIQRSENYDREGTEGTCDGYKFSYCDAIASCSAFMSREQCELNVGPMICHAEAAFADCQTRIDAALDSESCEDLPEDCAPEFIADRTIPIQLCQEIHESICEYGLFCGLELSLEGCMDSLARTEPCQNYTAAHTGAFQCADAYDMLACGQPMPDVCVGTLR